MRREGLPIDLAVIPLLESGNNPLAKSPKNALGLWQFIPSTAKEWGLKTYGIIDDRRNVIKSTQTAIRYLKYLHNQLNNWDLALAAYNWGIGSVKKALKKGLYINNKIDLRKLPRETRKYLVAFHQLNRLIRFNVNSPEFMKYSNVEYLTIIRQPNLEAYLKENKLNLMSSSVLKHINGYDVWKNPERSRDILVPTLAFSKHFSIEKISYKTKAIKSRCGRDGYYKTRYKDTFIKIAKKYKIKMDVLKDMNPGINFLRPGMKIKLCE